MPFKTMYHSDFYTIEVDVEGNLLQSKWHRPVTEQEVKTGGTKLYEVLRDTKVEHAVADAQNVGAIPPTAKDWLSSTFYELLSQTSLKRLARVLPKSVFHQIALESVVTRAEALGVTQFEVKNFGNEQDAFAWAKGKVLQ
ncbi:hypothetical protein ABID22_004048 [Pontibacter aydingkolensis]|uniref:SpoIIAA-like n=1 Tax=Pontibacter aydingkolensis TaxID=1911536 RepID=A0ABS7D0X6_9BACT|nr:hypothetical protein [Pontibacter aydingkolensis]MBW7469287.1 hypothetical protein [Pontibacter aydingkolensis]